MFWWFERSGRYVRCETRFITKGSYEFVITQPDGTERVEHFTDAEAMTRRQEAAQRELADDGWTGPHGWNI
jgi:hypothetical protein